MMMRRVAPPQSWLKARGYQPSDLRLSALTRLGARLTITVDSVFAWMSRAGLGRRAILVKP